MDKVLDQNLCTGCTACANICPKKAITMIESEDGFKYPVIDNIKCINCGLCRRTCPVLNFRNNQAINKCYAGYSTDSKAKEKSSSGGVFSLISDYILDNNGLVIGAAFDEKNILRHIAITKTEELEKLRGSKYLQSDLNDIFKFIKENLPSKKILFVGTPCQVAGLKAFLKQDYDNLLCIDLFCHGVPSPKLFSKYVKDLEKKYNSKLLSYNFRDKSTGWDTYSTTAHFKNKTISEPRTKNNYMKLFLSDNALRNCCYNCNFKLGNKYSDITLGDFWGIKEVDKEMYNKEGTSAIIINTIQGKEILKRIKNKLVYKECNLEDIIKGNPSLVKSAPLTKKRKSFYKDLNNISFDQLTIKYKKRVPIIKKIKSKVKRILKLLISRH